MPFTFTFTKHKTSHFEHEKRIIRQFVFHKNIDNVTAWFMHVNILQIRQHSFVGFNDNSTERWKDVKFVFDIDVEQTKIIIEEENNRRQNDHRK